MSRPPDESDLVSRAVAGDAAAVQELLLLHYDPLAARLAHAIPADLQGTIAVEDVLQEAFADAVRRFTTFEARGDGAFGAWLGAIADNRLIDLIRAARALKRGGGQARIDAGAADRSSVDDLLAQLAVNERTPSRSVAGHEAAGAIRRALDGLNEDYRTAIQLRYFDGLSVAETAARMNRTEPAIHMLCHRAIAQLRQLMGSESDFFSRSE